MAGKYNEVFQMQTVRLEGQIGEKFGTEWTTNCTNIPDIFKLIDCQTPGFRNYIIEAAENNIDFAIKRGVEFIGEEELLLSIGEEDIIITEIPAGQKSGWGKVLAAIALVVVMVLLPPAAASAPFLGTGMTVSQVGYMMAANLALTGIQQIMSPGPEVDSPEANQGYLFNGPVNTAKQGLPVPIAYGELIVGGSPISTSFQSTKFPKSNYSYKNNSRYYNTNYTTFQGDTMYSEVYGSGEQNLVNFDDEDLGI